MMLLQCRRIVFLRFTPGHLSAIPMVVRTWDDMPEWIYCRVSDCQHHAVNLLIGDGYEIVMAWPDLNYEEQDRIIIMTEKQIEPGKVAVAYVTIDGLVNCTDPYLYLTSEDYWWKEPEHQDPQ